MALSQELRKRLVIALTDRFVGTELADAVDAAASAAGAAGTAAAAAQSSANTALARVATNVAVIGATANLVGVDGTGSNAAPLVETESRLDTVEGKVDAIIAALVAADLMAP